MYRPLTYLVLFFLSYEPCLAQTESAITSSQPCIAVQTSLDANVKARIETLNKRAADIKSSITNAQLESLERSTLEKQLVEVQEQLLTLLFEQECARSDFKIQVLRGPSDPPPAWVDIATFFATNRKPTGNGTLDTYFGPDRQQTLQYGKVVVSIPTNRKPGDLNLPKMWKLEFSPDPRKHFVLKDIVSISSDGIQHELESYLASSTKRSLLIFVHGYNVGFSDAALRSAQLAHDLAFQGATLFFSWPSAATARGYWHDEEAVQLSEAAFDEFLDRIDSFGSDDIFLIAHSMGNRLVTTVLANRIARGKPTPHVREILLAAPDINSELFQEKIAPVIAGIDTHRTIYASSSDVALRASKIVHDYRRVGETDGGVGIFPQFETIDVSAAAPLIRSFGHSYVVDSADVIKDIAQTLTGQMGADQRNLSRLGTPPNIWWTIK
ncbi:alpha/beta hydrolase [Bradyrhizobium sp. Bra78]|uniref:alpha/beta hydrolase n=1 Tax=Bradyrhizobium sp. Bra78 TaxID=2926010 RepID=UPI0021C81447|nr:alpha/beta fold hydrolase [Bradyrhizobium sp. Bra78]